MAVLGLILNHEPTCKVNEPVPADHPVGPCDCANFFMHTLDALGIALANHNHIWTDQDRWMYEESVRLLKARV